MILFLVAGVPGDVLQFCCLLQGRTIENFKISPGDSWNEARGPFQESRLTGQAIQDGFNPGFTPPKKSAVIFPTCLGEMLTTFLIGPESSWIEARAPVQELRLDGVAWLAHVLDRAHAGNIFGQFPHTCLGEMLVVRLDQKFLDAASRPRPGAR